MVYIHTYVSESTRICYVIYDIIHIYKKHNLNIKKYFLKIIIRVKNCLFYLWHKDDILTTYYLFV